MDLCHGVVGWRYRMCDRLPCRTCCSVNSVAGDPSGWYEATARLEEASTVAAAAATGYASIRFTLAFKDVFAAPGAPAFQKLHWSDLADIHGRRIHVSAVADDLSAAWHVHPPDVTRDDDTSFRVRLKLPAGGTATAVRLLFNFGILADRVGLCVDEAASHVDPAPGGQKLVVEGVASSPALTLPSSVLTATSSSPVVVPVRRSPRSHGLGDARVVTPLPLEGRDSDEIADASPMTRELELPCEHEGDRAGAKEGKSGRDAAGGGLMDTLFGNTRSCWEATITVGELWPALNTFQERLAQAHGDELKAARLFDGGTGGGAPSSSTTSTLEAVVAASFVSRTATPACLGLNIVVHAVGGGPATYERDPPAPISCPPLQTRHAIPCPHRECAR